MGQTIEVKSVVLGKVALFDTDRTMTGQDGHGFEPGVADEDGTTTAGRLAGELFAGDAAIDHIFILSNQVTVRRTDGWSKERADETAALIRDFFVFYDDNRGGSEEASGG